MYFILSLHISEGPFCPIWKTQTFYNPILPGIKQNIYYEVCAIFNPVHLDSQISGKNQVTPHRVIAKKSVVYCL